MKRLLALFLIVGWCLAACGTVPPAPVDHFYRLQPVSVSVAAPSGNLGGAIAVLPFRADSLFAERPMVYADESSLRQLRQYHYHLWLYPPAQALQEHLVASLGKALDLRAASDGSGALNQLEGRVLGLERVVSARSSKAVVVLELKLTVAGRPTISRTYQAEQASGDESLNAFVVATEKALGRIYGEFLADVAQSRRP